MVRTKVFVGNLSFKTKEPELRAHFGAVGNVIDVNIITRGPRSLGYGFVEMESEEAANAAIAQLHHKDVDGRQINVELVKEPKEGEEVKERKPREPKQPKAPRENQGGEKDEADAAPRATKPKRTRKPSNKSRDANEGENVRDGTQGVKPARDPKQPRPERVDKTTGQKKSQSEGEQKEKKPREPREPRPKKTNENRAESETLLFVANLPFSLDNDTFTSFVTGHGIAVKQAYVVKKHNNRSKGYGFIEFNNAAEQKAALEKLSGLSIQDRPISVKIALTPPPSDETEGKQETPKPAAPSTPSGGVSSPKPLTPNTNKEQGVKSPKPEGTASPKAKKEEK